VYFILEYKFKGQLLSENEFVETIVNNDHEVKVRIQGPVVDAQKNNQSKPHTSCVAYLERKIKPENLKEFENILKNKDFDPCAVRSQTYSGGVHKSVSIH